MEHKAEKENNSPIDAETKNNIFSALQTGISLQQEGELESAADIYQRILKKDPFNINALNLLGIIANEKKNFKQAINIINRAINIKPNHASLYTNLGIALQGANNLKEAKLAYMHAISLNVGEHKAHYNLGVILQKENLYNDAIMAYHKVIKYNPNNTKAYNNIGCIYQIQNRFDDAIVNFKQALALLPNSYTTYNNLGLCLKDGKRNLNDAITMFKKCLELNNKYPEAWNNLGLTLKELGKFDDAIFALNKSLSLSPNNPEIHYNLGTVYQIAGNIREANMCYLNALAINPYYVKALNIIYHTKRQLCDWQNIEKFEEDINTKEQNNTFNEEPFLNIIRTNDIRTNHKMAMACSQQIKKKMRNFKQKFSFINRKENQAELTIGYIYGDFYDNELAYVIGDLFELHDRKKFKTFCYSYGHDDNSNIRTQLNKTADKFFNISNYNHLEAARCIYQDQVDILVDLQGYSPNHRIEILALKPAPIQVNYLGFPGTTGADFYNYILTDQTVSPEKDKRHYTEAFAYLPKCYQSMNFKQDSSTEQVTRQQLGIPSKAFVLSSFNESYKFDKEMMNIWAEILAEIPNAILWLYHNNNDQCKHIADFLQKQYINPNRIYYVKPISREKHLARLKLVDLNIDTKIFNGSIATSNALWLNIPTITIEGNNFASRMSASILRALDLEECITHSTTEYKNKVLELARNKTKLENLKAKIIANKVNSMLFDTTMFVKNLEAVYSLMWQEYVAGKSPSIIRV